ncbi:MAG: rpe, Ribulose-phosphate 3-epimerase, partial [Candidatus Saccharibacteria bacterium]|nr:rpe, Ribulose-phosphate 3-epimerase [Candidatus Saccharibacteria bacterium]
MYKNPLPAVKEILTHRPHLIIVHAEAQGDFNEVLDLCRQAEVKIGVALLPATSPDYILSSLDLLDHVLIFSGDLGSFGGHADLSLLAKVETLKKHKPDLEIGWDGGVNIQNVAQLVTGGVDVLNVGGYIQKAADPAKAYSDLMRIADETGTT